ncbi:MAG: cytochrome c biogenesis protein CcsA, partial [Polyangia bacterium]
RRFEALGGFVAASAALFGVAAQAISARPDTPNQRWLMAIHITTNLLGGGLLLVAGGAASFYLWHARRLRHRHLLGQGAQLPPLESLDAVVHRLLWIGVPLLTVGMLTGRAAIKLVQIVTAGEKLRATLGVASWLVLLAVLALRHLARWRGRRLALATLLGAIGIFALIVLYVGRALVGDGL